LHVARVRPAQLYSRDRARRVGVCYACRDDTFGCAFAGPMAGRCTKDMPIEKNYVRLTIRLSPKEPVGTVFTSGRRAQKTKNRAKTKKHKSKHCSGCTDVRIDPQGLRRIEADKQHGPGIAKSISLTADLRVGSSC
jgi:hypothetical protein